MVFVESSYFIFNKRKKVKFANASIKKCRSFVVIKKTDLIDSENRLK
jgi:hypothetical protein